MNWGNYLQNFEEWVASSPSNPPYFLLFAGLFICITSGIAFIAVLRQQVQVWFQTRSPGQVSTFERLKLLVPYAGAIAGFFFFLGSSLEVFGLSTPLAWVLSIILTALTSSFGWSQLGKSLGRETVRSYLNQTFGTEK